MTDLERGWELTEDLLFLGTSQSSRFDWKLTVPGITRDTGKLIHKLVLTFPKDLERLPKTLIAEGMNNFIPSAHCSLRHAVRTRHTRGDVPYIPVQKAFSIFKSPLSVLTSSRCWAAAA